MKIIVPRINAIDADKLIKRCGYAEIKDHRTNQVSYVHRLGAYFYPRFHIYIQKEGNQEIVYNLHLDQKKPSYLGQSAHSADYDGEIVQKEAERIRELIIKQP